MDNFGRDFLRLALSVGRHMEGYVRWYSGPAGLRDAVEADEAPSVPALLDEVQRLQANLPMEDAKRAASGAGSLRAMDLLLRRLMGETFGFEDTLSALYDITPVMVDEAVFAAAHADLEALLPGTGSLAARVGAWMQTTIVPEDKLLAGLLLCRDEVRARTRAWVDLPDEEELAVEIPEQMSWLAQAAHMGGGRTRVQINGQAPFPAMMVLDLMAHEGYPGHHTEILIKLRDLADGRGQDELRISPMFAPEVTVQEGMAMSATEVIFGGGEYAWMTETLFPALGLADISAEALRGIQQARKALETVRTNAAMLIHSGAFDHAAAAEYIAHYELADLTRAHRQVAFVTNPLLWPYAFTFTEGYRLVAETAARSFSGDKGAVFKRLLAERVLPSALGRW